ncbi:Crp/Fnr family transcriptional regulator [Sinomicrobium sp. M5D2P9]
MSRYDKMIRTNRELLRYITKIDNTEPGCIVMESYHRKEQIIGQGKKVFSVYIVKKGMVKCYLTEDNGKDFIQEFFGEGEIFGEIEVLNDTLSFCAVEAVTGMEVYKIPKEYFIKLLNEDADFNSFIMKSLATKVHYKALRHSHNQLHAIEDNLFRLKKQFPQLLDIIPKRDIANYLGITLRSLNRVISELGTEDH